MRSDWMAVERERGISVSSAVMSFEPVPTIELPDWHGISRTRCVSNDGVRGMVLERTWLACLRLRSANDYN